MIRILPIYGHAAQSQGIIILKHEVLYSSVHKTSSISCLLLYRKGHKSEMQKNKNQGQKIRAISCKSEL